MLKVDRTLAVERGAFNLAVAEFAGQHQGPCQFVPRAFGLRQAGMHAAQAHQH